MIVLCKNCKYSAPDIWGWSMLEHQQKQLVCTISSLDPVNGMVPCAEERSRLLFGSNCGPSGRNFQEKATPASGA